MERYYLVSPEKEKKKDKGYFYWMRENDDNWVQFVKGIWCPKTNKDEIKLCGVAKQRRAFLRMPVALPRSSGKVRARLRSP